MSPGSVLEVCLDGGEPIEQVPDSLIMEGYQVLKIEDCEGYFLMSVLRPE
jgi:TusA-related sulfurtransferase